jgi:integrase
MRLKDFPGVTVDRSEGIVRRYYRAVGRSKVRLNGEPGSEQFLREYLAAKNGTTQPAPKRQRRDPTAPRVRGVLKGDPAPMTLRWLSDQYQASPEWKKLDPFTQLNRRGLLAAICATPSPVNGTLFGDGPFSELKRAHVKAIHNAHSDKPSAAAARVGMVHVLFNWAIEAELHDGGNPASQMPLRHARKGGHHTWTEDELAAFEATHPIGSKARLAYSIFFYTGVRISDAVRLGPPMERNGVLSFIEFKHGRSKYAKFSPKPRKITMPPELREIIKATPTVGLRTYLVNTKGEAYCRWTLADQLQRWCIQAGLNVVKPDACTAHGIRKAGATRIARNKGTVHQLKAYGGWTTLSEVQRYTAAVELDELNAEAGALLHPLKPRAT